MRAHSLAMALLFGLLAGAVMVGAAMLEASVALRAWLVAGLIVLMVPLGALAWLLTWHLHRGLWGRVLGRSLEAAVATLPLVAILLLPLFLGADAIYAWPHEEGKHATPWLRVGWFAGRGFLYVLAWAGLAVLAVRFHRPLAASPHRPALASAGLILWTLTASFAAVDWGLSLQPETYSSIYGMIFLAHLMVGALVFCVAATLLARPVPAEAVNGIANILLGALMMWGYLAFMQYLIVWMGDLPGHIEIYLSRTGGVWSWMLWAVVLLHGVVPFVLLLRGPIRRSRDWLLGLCLLVLALRVVEGVWLWLPAFDVDAALVALTAVALVAWSGLWGAAWLWFRARLPEGDPVVPAPPTAEAREARHG